MELQDYEYIRNLTLLFFLERLLDKGESRSLHDLSCQFGTKGFTKEMRQIAGGSKAGLKKFLAGYPSLFSIQNDYVSIAEIIRHSKEEDSSSPGKNGSRDYFHEAMLYFKDKLKQYGEDIEVPIKSLLGHRSQAPPEVRHVSGQHVKEFRDFLLRFEDEFVVGEETIYLKEYDGNITRMYTDDQPVSRSSQPSSLDPSQTVPPPALPVPAVGLSGSEQQVQSKQIIDFLKSTILSSNFESKPSVETLFTMLEGHFSSNSSNSSSSGLKLPLRTSQDLKTFLKIYPHIFCVQGGLVSLVAATATPGASPSRRISRDTMSHDSKASLKDRIGFLVQRAVQDNSSSQRGVSSSGRTSTTTTATPSMTSSNSAVAPAASSNNEAVTKIISSVDESVTVVQGLMSAHKVVALSVKGVNLGSEGSIISSIQIGTLDGLSYVFDVLACPNLIEKGCLKDLLEDNDKVKVIHDCRNESSTLWTQFGIRLENVFDTQSAYAVIQHQNRISSVYKVKNVSLLSLCSLHNIAGIEIMEQIKLTCRKDQNFWVRRPWERELVHLAAYDVIHIYPSLYLALSKSISAEYIPLLNELCSEQVLLPIEPDLVKEKKKQRKIQYEIADVKDKLSSAQAKNVVLSNREIRLLRYIDLSEDDVKKIKGSLKVAKKLEKLQKQNTIPADDMGSNPPSLESISSGHSALSDNSNEGESLFPTSPDHRGAKGSSSSSMRRTTSDTSVNDSVHKQTAQEMLRIEKLEAMIADISTFGQDQDSGGPSSLVLDCYSTPEVVRKSVETQTLSTGDIVITKVYNTEQQQ